MTLKALFSLVSCAVLLAVVSTAGCGGSSSSNKDGAAGSGGNSNTDAPGRGAMDAATEGAMGGNPAEGGVAGSGGGAGGTGGSTTDARPDTGGGGTGGAADAAVDMTVIRVCAAGEMCTGNSMCNATTRCVRGEREVCHCINDSLFCGPAPCDTPDANTTPDARPDAMTPACPMGIQSGDDCMGGMDRQCETACVAGRQRTCFCNNAVDSWLCTTTRCM